MITMETVKNVFARIKAYIPETLPQGLTAYNAWATDVLKLAKVPDNDSTRFALAIMILHLPPQASSKAKEYFIRTLRKGATNEIAASVAQELKTKQQQAQLAASKPPEATGPLTVVSNGPQK